MKKGVLYMEVYNAFKSLCAEGKQTCSFARFCRERNISAERMHYFMKDNGLHVKGLPGYSLDIACRKRWEASSGGVMEVPFENVIFEEAGFLPAGQGNMITVSVDGRVAVSFPADTDVAVVARFVRKMGKEVGHVES